jgi:hypothetical protein
MVGRRNWIGIFIFLGLTLVLVYSVRGFVFNLFGNFLFSGNVIVDPDLLQNLLIPSAISSIVFSIIGLITMVFLIFQLKKGDAKRIFPFRGYLAAVSLVFIIFLINYFITLFPYGNLVLQIVSFILQIMIYGILLPYILVAQITYIVLLLKEDIRGVLS